MSDKNFFQQNWLIFEINQEKKSLSLVMTIKQRKCIMFIAINILSFLNNWKWKMFYEVKNIQWKHCINALKLLKVYNTRPLFVLDLLCFYSKVWTYITSQQQQKTGEQITASSLNQHDFSKSRKKKDCKERFSN